MSLKKKKKRHSPTSPLFRVTKGRNFFLPDPSVPRVKDIFELTGALFVFRFHPKGPRCISIPSSERTGGYISVGALAATGRREPQEV